MYNEVLDWKSLWAFNILYGYWYFCQYHLVQKWVDIGAYVILGVCLEKINEKEVVSEF